MSQTIPHHRVTYNGIHNLIRNSVSKIAAEFNPDLLIAIGGGGFFPARVMRTFLRETTANKTLQIQAIGLSLYEPIPGTTAQQIGKEVIRTQWLGPNPGRLLVGKKSLIIDEVDDTRKTLHFALSELQKDVEEELLNYPESVRLAMRSQTSFAVFVVHNKNKDKLADLPPSIPYFAGAEIGDVWLDYPWEATDIEEHDQLATLQDQGQITGQ